MCNVTMNLVCAHPSNKHIQEYVSRLNNKNKPHVVDDYNNCSPTWIAMNLEGLVRCLSKDRDKSAVYLVTQISPCDAHTQLGQIFDLSKFVDENDELYVYYVTKLNNFLTLDSELSNWDIDTEDPDIGVSSNIL